MRAIDAEHYLLDVKLKARKVPDFNQYPFSLPVVHHLHTLELHPKVTFIVGENGSGKSTLLEAIAIAWGFNPEGGTKNFTFQTRASHSTLHEYLTLAKSVRRARDGFFLRAEFLQPRYRNRAPGPGPRRAADHRFVRRNFVAPAIPRRVVLRADGQPLRRQWVLRTGRTRSRAFPAAPAGDDRAAASTGAVAFAIRDRHALILMAYPDACIYQIREDGLHQVEYEQTEHYQVTKAFLDNPARQLDRLMG